MTETIVGGKYRIRELIGEGNMGSVYEAEHVNTGRRCALKVISSPDLVDDPEVVGRFEREARAAGVVSSRHIAQVMDSGVDEQTKLPYLVMEYLEGEDLHSLFERVGPLPADLALRITAQACLGLQKAHEAKVVHRDVKPHNLYLCLQDVGEVVVKLLDFGVAKMKMDQASTMAGAGLTATGSLLGSPRYMSPEQALGSKSIDQRTDIWSLGAVLYEALSGRPPFQEPETLADLILALSTQTPVPLGERVAGLPEPIAALVARALAREPDERFQSAKEMFDAIVPLVDGGWSIHFDMLAALDEPEPSDAPGGSEEAEAEDADENAGDRDGEAASADDAPNRGMAATRTAPVAGGDDAEGAQFGETEPMLGTPPGAGTLSRTVPAAPAVAKQGGSAATTARARSSSTGRYAVAALAVAAAAAVGWLATRGSGDGSAAAPSPTQAPAGSESGALPGGSSRPAAAGSNEDAHRVQLVILPADAGVEVDDKPVEVHGSIVTLEGEIGTVYKVRVFQGSAEAIADVVISNSGAIPPKIEVVPGRVVRLGAAGSSSATASPTAGAPGASAATGPSPRPPKPADPTQLDSDMREFD